MTILLLFCSIPDVSAQQSNVSARCEEIREKIRLIRSRQRAGYTAKTGVRLEARLRKLRKERARICRSRHHVS